MAPYLEGPVTPVQVCAGLVPVQLNRPALIFSSELSSAAPVPTSRNKGPNCNRGSEWLKATPDTCPAFSPIFPYCTKRRRKHLPDLYKHQTILLQMWPFLHKGVSLLSPGCKDIRLRSDVSCAEDTWASKTLLGTKQIPREQLFRSLHL